MKKRNCHEKVLCYQGRDYSHCVSSMHAWDNQSCLSDRGWHLRRSSHCDSALLSYL